MQPRRHVRTSETRRLTRLDADEVFATRPGPNRGCTSTIHYGASLIPVTVAEPV